MNDVTIQPSAEIDDNTGFAMVAVLTCHSKIQRLPSMTQMMAVQNALGAMLEPITLVA
jgi:hypothetical protein